MKRITFIAALICCMFTLSNLSAQRGQVDLEKLKSELSLSDQQVQQLEILMKDNRDKMKTLRENKSTDREAMQTQMQAMRKSSKAAIESVLNEEQKVKFNSMEGRRPDRMKRGGRDMAKSGERGMRGEMRRDGKHTGRRMHGDKRSELTEEQKLKREEHKAEMLEQRAKLEKEISKSDKKKIDELRTRMLAQKAEMKKQHEAMRAEREEMRKSDERPSAEERETMRAKAKAQREEMKNSSESKELQSLVEKYRNDMEPLLADVDAKRKAMQEERMESRKKDMEQRKEEMKQRSQKRKGEMRHRKGEMKERSAEQKEEMQQRRLGHFLLLDPEASEVENGASSKSMTIKPFPNPATDRVTINFELNQKESFKMELRDISGNVIQNLGSKKFNAGQNSKDIDVSNLGDGTYYIFMIGDQGTYATEKIVVAR